MSFPTSDFFDRVAAGHGLADRALYTPAGSSPLSLVGKFSNDYVDPFNAVQAAQPVFRCALAAFAPGDPKQNDLLALVSVDGRAVSTEYKVKTVQRDTPQVGDVLLVLKVRA